jgi:hypothetical protein
MQMIFAPIFEGLPSYCNGSISFEDLEDAVHHLSKPHIGNNPIFENPKETSLFFRSMDTCNSGTLNFREFALGMLNDNIRAEIAFTHSLSSFIFKLCI